MRFTGPLPIALVFVIFLFSACQTEDTETEAAPDIVDVSTMELRTYSVPAGIQDRVASLFRSLMYRQGMEPLGHVEEAPGNRLVVVAPGPIQSGIGQLLEELQDVEPAAEEPPATINMTYSLVLSRPSAEVSDTSSFQRLAPALDAIQSSQGPLDFVLLEQLELRSMEDQRAEISGRYADVHQMLARHSGQVLAEVRLGMNDGGGHELTTLVRLGEGQQVVLGHVGLRADFASNPFDLPTAITTLTITPTPRYEVEPGVGLFYIVEATVE